MIIDLRFIVAIKNPQILSFMGQLSKCIIHTDQNAD